ncbi:MAG: 3-oxoacyl-[acyl-carrier-protein] reductase [Bacteroidales bacterium]|nr:3-oxoacyl-[acyl-carrier-protein] reductase [Bacteroidales bacterium]
MKLLENKIALITGASRGIGRATALMLADNGADVLFTDFREDENSQSLVAELTAKGVRTEFFAADASNHERTLEIAKTVQDKYGRLDILINNAGITRDNLLLRMSEADWDLVINCNLKSVFNYCKAFTPMMLKQRSGSIINISSIVGINGNAGQCNYSSTKAGIIGFTRSLAKELGSRSVRVNAIAPGFIETPMTKQLGEAALNEWLKAIPMRRPGQPDDIARTAVYLASELSTYITGQVLRCDGGLSL